MACCVIGLGANLGNAAATLRAATNWLAAQPGIRQLHVSQFAQSAPAGGPAGQPSYLNAAARFETDLAPEALLALLQQGEAEFGRERRETWGPRTLDLDLLLYDQLELTTPLLTLPHPRLAFRRFVLEPAVEIAGETFHPTLRATLSQLLQHVNSAPRYVAVAGACWFAKQYVVASAAAGLKASGVPVRLLVLRGMTVVGAPAIEDPDHSFVEHYVDLVPRLADELREALTSSSDWIVGSYWPGELALGARMWFTGAARAAAEEAYCSAFSDVPLPQLLVYLETPDDLLLFSPSQPGHDATYYEQARRLATQRDALDRQVAELSGVPLLRASADKPEAAIRELHAAVTALTPK